MIFPADPRAEKHQITSKYKRRCFSPWDRGCSTRYFQPWITQKCKRLSRRKKRAYKRAKKSSKPADWERFKQLSKESRKTCKSAFNNFVKNCVSPEGVNNPKKLFRFMKSRRCENDGVAPLRDNGSLHNDNSKKANILNKQFSSVFSIPDGRNPPCLLYTSDAADE